MINLKTISIIALITSIIGGTIVYLTFFKPTDESVDTPTQATETSFESKSFDDPQDQPAQITDPNSEAPVIDTKLEPSSEEVKVTQENDTANQTTSTSPQTRTQEAISQQAASNGKLEFSSLKITSPIIYSRLEDLFQKNSDGTINLKKPIQEDLSKGPTSTPVQKLLTKGVVHLAFTPIPGQIGNSYIVGHSSNYKSVKSDYNYIFANLEKAQIGDEFTITSPIGQILTFKVFENIAINAGDTEIAYKDFGDKRIVTLQASILVNSQPLKRRLVRGELVN